MCIENDTDIKLNMKFVYSFVMLTSKGFLGIYLFSFHDPGFIFLILFNKGNH